MNKPILVKENQQLALELERELTKLVKKFEKDTGLCITSLEIETYKTQLVGPTNPKVFIKDLAIGKL